MSASSASDDPDALSVRVGDLTVEGMKLWESFAWPSADPEERIRYAGLLFLQALRHATMRPWEEFVHDVVDDHLTANVHPARVAMSLMTFARNWRAWRKRSRIESAQVLALDAIWTLSFRESKGKPVPDRLVRDFQRAANAIARGKPLKGAKEEAYRDLVGWVRNNADGTRAQLRLVVMAAVMRTYAARGPRANELIEAVTAHLWEHGVHVGKRDLVREDLTKSKRSSEHERVMNAILRAMDLEPPRSGYRKASARKV